MQLNKKIGALVALQYINCACTAINLSAMVQTSYGQDEGSGYAGNTDDLNIGDLWTSSCNVGELRCAGFTYGFDESDKSGLGYMYGFDSGYMYGNTDWSGSSSQIYFSDICGEYESHVCLENSNPLGDARCWGSSNGEVYMIGYMKGFDNGYQIGEYADPEKMTACENDDYDNDEVQIGEIWAPTCSIGELRCAGFVNGYSESDESGKGYMNGFDQGWEYGNWESVTVYFSDLCGEYESHICGEMSNPLSDARCWGYENGEEFMIGYMKGFDSGYQLGEFASPDKMTACGDDEDNGYDNDDVYGDDDHYDDNEESGDGDGDVYGDDDHYGDDEGSGYDDHDDEINIGEQWAQNCEIGELRCEGFELEFDYNDDYGYGYMNGFDFGLWYGSCDQVDYSYFVGELCTDECRVDKSDHRCKWFNDDYSVNDLRGLGFMNGFDAGYQYGECASQDLLEQCYIEDKTTNEDADALDDIIKIDVDGVYQIFGDDSVNNGTVIINILNDLLTLEEQDI